MAERAPKPSRELNDSPGPQSSSRTRRARHSSLFFVSNTRHESKYRRFVIVNLSIVPFVCRPYMSIETHCRIRHFVLCLCGRQKPTRQGALLQYMVSQQTFTNVITCM